MYIAPSFKTKKALREAVTMGRDVFPYQPGGIFDGPPDDFTGELSVEGPSYEPHTWYARVKVVNGHVIKVLK